MARKETPDVLGEILSGAAPESAPASAPESPARPGVQAPRPRVRTTSLRRTPDRAEDATTAPHHWEYLVVSFGDYHGWRPRFVNGQEIKRWMDAPLIHQYLAELGDDGWELVGASSGKSMYGTSDTHQLYFKRAKR